MCSKLGKVPYVFPDIYSCRCLPQTLYLKYMKKDKEQIVQADTEEGQIAGEVIIDILENQIADKNPPETKETLERLIKNGETRENAMRYIASVFSIEIFGVIKNQEPYNNKRYLKNLKALPKLPNELQ